MILSFRQYRRECLKILKSDLHEELDFMDLFSKENPKNYQIWYHRRAVVELLGDASRELDFCSEVFEIDSKNYHAWAHRYVDADDNICFKIDHAIDNGY